MMLLFDVFLNVQVGAWAKIDFDLIVSHPLIYSWPLFTLSEHTKRTDFVDETGYIKNNNFDNRQISRTFVLGAQKNCLIETLLLTA